MHLLALGISLLALSAGMFLLAKTKAENLGNIFRMTACFIIAASVLIFGISAFGAMFHMYGKPDGHEKKMHKMKGSKMMMHHGMHGGNFHCGCMNNACINNNRMKMGCGTGQGCITIGSFNMKDSCAAVCPAPDNTSKK